MHQRNGFLSAKCLMPGLLVMCRDWLNDPWEWYIGILGAEKKIRVQIAFLCVYSQLTVLRSCSYAGLFLYCCIYPAALSHLLRKICYSPDMDFVSLWLSHHKKSWFVHKNHFFYPCFLFLNDHELALSLRTVNLILSFSSFFDFFFFRQLSQPSRFLPWGLKFSKSFLPFNWVFAAMIKPIIASSFLYSKISVLGLMIFYSILCISIQSKKFWPVLLPFFHHMHSKIHHSEVSLLPELCF